MAQNLYSIRADHDAQSIVMYQAYSDAIADAALKAQRFCAPFSFRRITWIKPSYLWLMHRSQWGQKANQTRVLRVRIKRSAFDSALREGVLTHPEGNRERWAADFAKARVHIQWDTERSLRGAALDHYSIQVGLTRHIIEDFVNDWTLSIEDFSAQTTKIREALKRGNTKALKRMLPPERDYPFEFTKG